jgi:phage baseplate assembly protein W
MSSPIISVPFRLLPNGTVATVDDSSDQGHAEQLGVLVSTKAGERVLVQAFGLTDPVFEGVSGSEITAAVATWGPQVTIDSVKVTYDTTGQTQYVNVSFT